MKKVPQQLQHQQKLYGRILFSPKLYKLINTFKVLTLLSLVLKSSVQKYVNESALRKTFEITVLAPTNENCNKAANQQSLSLKTANLARSCKCKISYKTTNA